MATQAPVIVQNRDGLLGVLEDPGSLRTDPGARVTIRLTNGRAILVPIDLLARQPDGSLRLDLSAADLARFDAEEPRGEATAVGAVVGRAAGEQLVVPVVAESAEITKRRVESGRVAVRKSVETYDEVVRETLTHEEVHVERVPINREVDGPVAQRQEGETLVIPVLKEVLVVAKRLVLVEEIRITQRRVEQPFAQTVTLRTEAISVDRHADAAASGEDNQ